ncbi:hypothetical protein QOZ80_1BG0054220 [Eleusine coracana subsp. coracana]|nr:hypothetical protein QOZ80_1BG0054220 [Eleusine coracana subsp. coracana]
MSSPPGSPSASALAMTMGRVYVALTILQEHDLLSETCRRDSRTYYCICCNRAYCSHCCFFHHVHLNTTRSAWTPTAFCTAVCSHHNHVRAGLPDAVVRVVKHNGRHRVRCTGTEWWTEHMDCVLADPVYVGEDERGRYYELLPVLRCGSGKYCDNVCVHHHLDVVC